jgi:hypothetical protein
VSDLESVGSLAVSVYDRDTKRVERSRRALKKDSEAASTAGSTWPRNRFFRIARLDCKRDQLSHGRALKDTPALHEMPIYAANTSVAQHPSTLLHLPAPKYLRPTSSPHLSTPIQYHRLPTDVLSQNSSRMSDTWRRPRVSSDENAQKTHLQPLALLNCCLRYRILRRIFTCRAHPSYP